MKYLAIAAALLASTSAQAADLTAQPYNWSGAYIGIQAGGRWTEESVNAVSGEGPISLGIKPKGGLIGGYAGYNHQFGNIVLGAEVSATLNSVSDNWNMSFTDYEDKAKSLTSLNARFGYAIDRTLLYATGGWSHAKYSTSMRPDSSGIGYITYDSKQNRNGYNIGAGVEYAFTDNIIARAEYRYFNFGKVVHEASEGQTKYKQQTAILGLAYKF